MNCTKLLFIFVFFIFYPLMSNVYAQTYLGVVVGSDFPHFYKENNSYFKVTDKFLERASIEFGLRVEQQITDKFFIAAKGVINQNRHNTQSYDHIQHLLQVKYVKYKSSLTLNWIPINGLSLGTGFSYTSIPPRTEFYRSGNSAKLFQNNRNLGLHSSVGFLYKNILIDLNYWADIKEFTPINLRDPLSSINSLELSISYMFKILNKINLKKGGKVICPRI